MAKSQLPLKLDDDLITWIRQEASKERRSINNFVENKLYQVKDLSDAITEAINAPEPKRDKSKWAERVEQVQKEQAERAKK